jgi:hypothetical protein
VAAHGVRKQLNEMERGKSSFSVFDVPLQQTEQRLMSRRAWECAMCGSLEMWYVVNQGAGDQLDAPKQPCEKVQGSVDVVPGSQSGTHIIADSARGCMAG